MLEKGFYYFILYFDSQLLYVYISCTYVTSHVSSHPFSIQDFAFVIKEKKYKITRI